MAIKSLMLPVLTGGAIAMGALVVSNARRWIGGRPRPTASGRRMESDPIGLREEDSAPTLDEPRGPVRVRTEAEVAAAAGVGWPLPLDGQLEPVPDGSDLEADTDVEASAASEAGTDWDRIDNAEIEAELGLNDELGTSEDGRRGRSLNQVPLANSARGGAVSGARGSEMSTGDSGTSVLDTNVDFLDFDAGVSARPMEVPEPMSEGYDAVDPDNLGSQWLVRATEAPGIGGGPTDDISEVPTDPNPFMSEASQRAADVSDEDPVPVDSSEPTEPGESAIGDAHR